VCFFAKLKKIDDILIFKKSFLLEVVCRYFYIFVKKKAMVYITRREHFNAAHRLFRPEFSDEKNEQVFGKCSNPNWHGHNYIMYVTVKGNVNPDTGFVMNLKELSVIIKTHILEPLDHKNMNLEVPFMQGIMPSTENLAIAIWNEIEKHLQHTGAHLHCVRIEETENNAVEYYGIQS